MYEFPEPIGTARYEDDVLSGLTRLQRLGIPQRPVAFYGSSSFRLWSSMAEDLHSLDVVNLGFGGGTALSGLHYYDQVLRPLRPAAIVLYFGENDIANDGLSGQTSAANLIRLCEKISVDLLEARLFVLETKQSPARWIYRDEVTCHNATMVEWCKQSDNVQFVETCRGLIGEHGMPIGRYYMPDFIHLNCQGYALWAEVLRAIPGLLKD